MYKFLFLFVCLLGASSAIAQTKSEIQIGVAIPGGDFADDDFDDAIFNEGKAGGAATGLSVGYKLLSPIGSENLFWTISAAFIYNGLNSDWKDEIEDDVEDGDVTFPKYFSIPLLAGLQLEKQVAETMGLYAEAGIGLGLFKATDLKADGSEDGYRFESETSFDLATGFTYKLGAGLIINDKYTVGLSYLNLGSHRLKYKTKYDETYEGESYNESEDGKLKKLSISHIGISLGFRF
ncbi:MAG: PorT family protein [Tannerella sp.]|jgi:opacity protein-like surface antigen|nr:PorT family protein [Tannerella sp.]